VTCVGSPFLPTGSSLTPAPLDSPVTVDDAKYLRNLLQEAFDAVAPGADVRLAGGHAAGRTACLDVQLIVGLPAGNCPPDIGAVVKGLAAKLTSKNTQQPSRWIVQPTSVWDDHHHPSGELDPVGARSIGAWRVMGTLRTAVNLVIVPADQLGAAELVWSSPPAWLESFDEELRKQAGCATAWLHTVHTLINIDLQLPTDGAGSRAPR